MQVRETFVVVRRCTYTACGIGAAITGLAAMAAAWPEAAGAVVVAIGALGTIATSAMGMAAVCVRRLRAAATTTDS
jgi:hypothetical protein